MDLTHDFKPCVNKLLIQCLNFVVELAKLTTIFINKYTAFIKEKGSNLTKISKVCIYFMLYLFNCMCHATKRNIPAHTIE